MPLFQECNEYARLYREEKQSEKDRIKIYVGNRKKNSNAVRLFRQEIYLFNMTILDD